MARNVLASFAPAIEAVRATYLDELERFAEDLRPRFEAGELRGFNDQDLEADEDSGRSFFQAHPKPTLEEYETWRRARPKTPSDELEDLCAERFGLDTEGTPDAFRLAYLIRSVSPGEDHTEDGQPVIGQAILAVAFDVLAIARARGWYQVTPGECPEDLASEWARQRASVAHGRQEGVA